MRNPPRVAIVGCGRIADQHVQAIRRAGSVVVGVCDREPLMAEQLAERLEIGVVSTDIEELLEATSPDVVHVTTPPQSHRELAIRCLDAGASVYLEKPFAVTASETASILSRAAERGLAVTAGHNYQFTPEMLRLRQLVRSGYLGGRPVHVESHWSYDLSDATYVAPLLGDSQHWVRQLPGGLFHNIVSHGIARLAEFLAGSLEDVKASAHRSQALTQMAGDAPLDELRVLIRDTCGTTAFFCFSTQVKPGLNRLRVCGPRNSVEVDAGSGSLSRRPGRSFKSYLTFVCPPVVEAGEQVRNALRNAADVLGRRLHHDSGMGHLVDAFHRRVRGIAEDPIPHREIQLTAEIMDEVFHQIGSPSVRP